MTPFTESQQTVVAAMQQGALLGRTGGSKNQYIQRYHLTTAPWYEPGEPVHWRTAAGLFTRKVLKIVEDRPGVTFYALETLKVEIVVISSQQGRRAIEMLQDGWSLFVRHGPQGRCHLVHSITSEPLPRRVFRELLAASQIEEYRRTIKHIIYKAKHDGSSGFFQLPEDRNTPSL